MTSTSPIDTPLAADALALARQREAPSVLNHSIRTHLFALRHAELLGLKPDGDFDAELLFVTCVLHDIGAFDASGRRKRRGVVVARRPAA